jgi:hypothetical protein
MTGGHTIPGHFTGPYAPSLAFIRQRECPEIAL